MNPSNADFFKMMLAGMSPMASQFAQGPVGPSAESFQPPPQQTQPVPMPRPRPAQNMPPAMSVPGQPMNILPPQAQPSPFSGEKGPQWTDGQWSQFWDQASGGMSR